MELIRILLALYFTAVLVYGITVQRFIANARGIERHEAASFCKPFVCLLLLLLAVLLFSLCSSSSASVSLASIARISVAELLVEDAPVARLPATALRVADGRGAKSLTATASTDATSSLLLSLCSSEPLVLPTNS